MSVDKIFVKNWLSVDVDALRHRNRYVVKAMYDIKKVGENGFTFYETVNEIIEDVTMTWDEIEQDGGVAQVNRDLQECYNLE